MQGKPSFKGEIIKAVISCILIPLHFIKIFCEIAVLPGFNQNGEGVINRTYYYQSIFDRLAREGIDYLLWISIAVTGLSLVLCALNAVVRENKTLKISGNIIFGISTVYFSVLLFLSFFLMHAY